MPSQKHTHTLRRHPSQKNIYLCTDPTCTFKNDRASLTGKIAKCFSCGQDYITTKYSMRLATPHCKYCTKGASIMDLRQDEHRDIFLETLQALEENVAGDGV